MEWEERKRQISVQKSNLKQGSPPAFSNKIKTHKEEEEEERFHIYVGSC